MMRSGNMIGMDATDDDQPPPTGHAAPHETTADRIEVTCGGPRITRIGVVLFLGLLIWWPLLLLAAAFVAPVVAVSAVVATAAAAVAVPTRLLMRRFRVHHRA
jgi:hypothetical protein